LGPIVLWVRGVFGCFWAGPRFASWSLCLYFWDSRLGPFPFEVGSLNNGVLSLVVCTCGAFSIFLLWGLWVERLFGSAPLFWWLSGCFLMWCLLELHVLLVLCSLVFLTYGTLGSLIHTQIAIKKTYKYKSFYINLLLFRVKNA